MFNLEPLLRRILTTSVEDLLRWPKGEEKAIMLAIDGLLVDGAHHKQWYLERILEALNIDLVTVRKELIAQDFDWDDGIAP